MPAPAWQAVASRSRTRLASRSPHGPDFGPAGHLHPLTGAEAGQVAAVGRVLPSCQLRTRPHAARSIGEAGGGGSGMLYTPRSGRGSAASSGVDPGTRQLLRAPTPPPTAGPSRSPRPDADVSVDPPSRATRCAAPGRGRRGPGLRLTAAGNLSGPSWRRCATCSTGRGSIVPGVPVPQGGPAPDFFRVPAAAVVGQRLRAGQGLLDHRPAENVETAGPVALQGSCPRRVWHLDLAPLGRGLLHELPQRYAGVVLWCCRSPPLLAPRERLARMCSSPRNGVLDPLVPRLLGDGRAGPRPWVVRVLSI